ncbi:MAG: hypothetical protein M3433_01725 [Actinomycetota bacterium]|nr:hypothetical protein [Actinomycetota bacterium]
MTRKALSAPLAASLLALALACPTPAAIINKQLSASGRRTFGSFADLGGALFDGSGRVSTALKVIAAFVLLAAIAATVAGVWQIMRGDRGGLELAASGVFGVLGLMAALTVVM